MEKPTLRRSSFRKPDCIHKRLLLDSAQALFFKPLGTYRMLDNTYRRASFSMVVGYYPHSDNPAIIHWTDGAPHLGGKHAEADYADLWFKEASLAGASAKH